jgi:hypothetical protein
MHACGLLLLPRACSSPFTASGSRQPICDASTSMEYGREIYKGINPKWWGCMQKCPRSVGQAFERPTSVGLRRQPPAAAQFCGAAAIDAHICGAGGRGSPDLWGAQPLRPDQ